MPNSPTVFIIDPDLSVQSTLTLAIRRTGAWPETFWSLSAFLAHPQAVGESCLLINGDSPEIAGFEAIQRLATERPETPVIILSSRSEVPLTVKAMRAGAIEFLVTPVGHESVLDAIAGALARSRAVLHDQHDLIQLRRSYRLLSAREREVMVNVVSGLLNKQVGAVLGISEITVKAHRGRVMRKMGAGSLAHLVGMALKLRLPVLDFGAGRIEPTTSDRRFSWMPSQLSAS